MTNNNYLGDQERRENAFIVVEGLNTNHVKF